MKLAEVKIPLLLYKALIYRVMIICIQTCFFWILTGEFKFAISTSLAWNSINMACYWIYHHSFAKVFSIRKEN